MSIEWNVRWALAVAALSLVALTSPITAGDKRSAALAVRVTVVRSCSVNTDPLASAAATVTCGTRFGPPAVSATSTVTIPLPIPPPARVDVAASTQAAELTRRDADASAPAAASDAALPSSERTAENVVTPPARGRGAGPGSEATPAHAPVAAVAFRVVTVNF